MVDQVNIPFYPPQDTGGYTQPPGTSFPPPVPYMPEPGPPIYPPQGSLPGEYGPDTPPPSSEPPPPSSPGEPSLYDTASGWIGGIAGSIFGSRRYRPSRFQRELVAAARRVGLSAVRGAMQAFGTFERVASESRALVPFESATPMTFGEAALDVGRRSLGGIGVATLLDLAFPPSLSETDQFPLPLKILSQGPFALQVRRMVAADQFTRSRRVPSAAVRELMNRAPDVLLGERPPTLVEKMQRIAPDLGIGRILNPAGWTPFRIAPNATVITATAPGFDDYVAPAAPSITDMAELAKIGPPVASSSSSAPASTAGKGQRLPAGQIRWGRIGIGVGAIVAANTLLPRLFSGSAYPSMQTAAPIAPGGAIATPPATSVQPGIGLQSLSFGGGQSGNCSCGPRGPRRKCLERAPVAWRSGRNKGKAAGSKCVRYAQRAS